MLSNLCYNKTSNFIITLLKKDFNSARLLVRRFWLYVETVNPINYLFQSCAWYGNGYMVFPSIFSKANLHTRSSCRDGNYGISCTYIKLFKLS